MKQFSQIPKVLKNPKRNSKNSKYSKKSQIFKKHSNIPNKFQIIKINSKYSKWIQNISNEFKIFQMNPNFMLGNFSSTCWIFMIGGEIIYSLKHFSLWFNNLVGEAGPASWLLGSPNGDRWLVTMMAYVSDYITFSKKKIWKMAWVAYFGHRLLKKKSLIYGLNIIFLT